MEIKTSEEIFDKCAKLGKVSIDLGLDKDFKLKNTRDILKKERWVSVDDILKLLKDDSITCFEDLQDNIINDLEESKIRRID